MEGGATGGKGPSAGAVVREGTPGEGFGGPGDGGGAVKMSSSAGGSVFSSSVHSEMQQ